jgi:hypothetical protein
VIASLFLREIGPVPVTTTAGGERLRRIGSPSPKK